MADKFRKAKSNFATTLVTGIGTGTGDTITLNSTTGLPTDTEITLTFNRVTSSGTVNSTTVMERITGTVDGSTLTAYTRGADGTTEQAHAAGTVVEYVWNADDLNDIIDGILVGHDQSGAHKFNAPEGFLLNGKIVPSVASNNLTVALKGLDGNDPSATNPIYVRIGDTVHSITSALSVTRNAGTNWFNSGSSELATKEVDYFVYLRNNNSTVDMIFSRVPYYTNSSEINTTSTNEKFASTVGSIVGSGEMCVIGRFAATLSAGAGYTWSVPTFDSKNLIQRPIFETRSLQWTPTLSCSGSMTYTSTNVFMGIRSGYKVVGGNMYLQLFTTGTTGGTASTDITATMPFSVGLTYQTIVGNVTEGAAYVAGRAACNNANVMMVKRYDGANWGVGASRGAEVYANIALV